jgi:hypothetical protein
MVSMVHAKLAVPDADLAVYGFRPWYFVAIVSLENMGELCEGK